MSGRDKCVLRRGVSGTLLAAVTPPNTRQAVGSVMVNVEPIPT